MLKQGQTLWFVPAYVKSGHEVIVEKVGRIWAHLSNGRLVDIKTMVVDGGGMCYLSQTAYQERIELEAAWSALQAEIRNQWKIPAGVTIDDINQARALLMPKKAGLFFGEPGSQQVT